MATKPCAGQSCWGAQSCASVQSPRWVSQCHVDGWCEPELDLLLAISLLPSSCHPASRTKSKAGGLSFLSQFLPSLRYFCLSVMFAAIYTVVWKQPCSSHCSALLNDLTSMHQSRRCCFRSLTLPPSKVPLCNSILTQRL